MYGCEIQSLPPPVRYQLTYKQLVKSSLLSYANAIMFAFHSHQLVSILKVMEQKNM